jgi:hypothetical protein
VKLEVQLLFALDHPGLDLGDARGTVVGVDNGFADNKLHNAQVYHGISSQNPRVIVTPRRGGGARDARQGTRIALLACDRVGRVNLSWEAFVVKLRIAISAALAISIALGTTGCNLFQPQATRNHYDPSDGVAVNVGDLDLRNLIVISDDGELGSLVLSGINTSKLDATVTVQYQADGKIHKETFALPYSEQPTSFGGRDEPKIVLHNIGTEPGAMMQIFFSYGSVTGAGTLVPVLSSAQPEYAGLAPEPEVTSVPTSTASPTATPTPSPTATAAH